MQPQSQPISADGDSASEDRATAVILSKGGADGVPAFVLRHWRSDSGMTEPVFVTWLLDVGRFCPRVKYGRFSLKGGTWYIDGGSGLRSGPSPLEQAQVEALLVSETLRERLRRSVPVMPAVVFFDMNPDRRIDRLARRSRVLPLCRLEGYARRLADVTAAGGFSQPLERRQVLEETSILIEGGTPVGAGSSRSARMGFRSASASQGAQPFAKTVRRAAAADCVEGDRV